MLLIEIDISQMVVEHWPQNRVTEPIIMHIRDFIVQKHRHTAMLIPQLFCNYRLLGGRQLDAGPSDPDEGCFLLEA